MRGMARYGLFILIIGLFTSLLVPAASYGRSTSVQEVTEWEHLWEDKGQQKEQLHYVIEALSLTKLREGWLQVQQSHNPVPGLPEGVQSAWIRLKLPAFQLESPGLYIPRLYAHDLYIFAEGRLLYESKRNYNYGSYKVLLPLKPEDSGREVYIYARTLETRIGIPEGLMAGDYQELLPQYFRRNLDDMVLGAGFILLAAIMFICTFFLKRKQMVQWLSLSMIILSIGILVITYSPYPYSIFSDYGGWFATFFDLALFTLFPGLCCFFESIFGMGPRGMITKFRRLITGYSLFCTGFLFVNLFNGLRYNGPYFFMSVTVMGLFMLATLMLLLGLSIHYAYKGSKDAMIFAGGFAFLALTGSGELVWFYVKVQNYDLFLWKWGVFGIVVALIILLGRQLARDHNRILQYTKELEMHNHRIQRSEKMQIISELAASVAHEVRNPLQVTRGFLQMLKGRSSYAKDQNYFKLAIDELDRAATIITDFLTFAKPQMDQVTVLDLSQELEQIYGIMEPMAHIQGVEISMDIPKHIRINGNSSKLKQALINIIKNSIEASPEQGMIRIWAYCEKGAAVIHIRDNGEGMEQNELLKLGEPYFSTKTKGTGLGLMVTFRIIEVMLGSICFVSKKGEGTEAVIRIPLAEESIGTQEEKPA